MGRTRASRWLATTDAKATSTSARETGRRSIARCAVSPSSARSSMPRRRGGCATLLEYMERRLGYGPRAAQERLRVAFALDKLPMLAETLASGELPFTAVRELTRVVTPETEHEWLASSQDKNVHEIQQLVSGHAPGDLPTDAPKPELVKKVLRYEVDATTHAQEREVRAVLEKLHGQRLDDDAMIRALFGMVLDAHREPTATTGTPSDARNGRAKYQIAVTLCRNCDRGWQESKGVQAPMDRAAIERAQCDAQHIGSLDTDAPARATQDVTPAVRRLVWHRDHERCAMPGCRSTSNLDIHHIIPRERGGSHAPSNLMLLCEAHHTELHEGLVTITGEAPHALQVSRRHDPHARTRSTKLHEITTKVTARAELVKRGYTRAEAAIAVDEVWIHAGANAQVASIVALALQRHPTSS